MSQNEQLRDRRGFRIRGADMTRVETFTDAAFAFAVSLLVISSDAVPTSFDQLTDALLGVPRSPSHSRSS
jgi:hypothetical protein